MSPAPLDELAEQIRSPVPFWFLNGPVEEWHVVREFEMMQDAGISEVVVHARYGLQVEYLSDGWFELVGWCVREARRHGMRIWIYDELNWPSGTAGMRLMQMDERHQSQYLAVAARPLAEIDLAAFEPGRCLVAANIEGGAVTKTRILESAHALAALTGNWLIFNCVPKRDPFYVDTLSRETVELFRRVTYEEYYKRFGDEFGRTIDAIFTDEPSIYWVSVGYDDWNLPYTDDYFSTFASRFGYEAAPMIPYLFYPGREGTAFRADYWDHAGRLFNERYHGTLGPWCDERGVIYTGHDHHEEPLRYQIRFAGDMFGAMRRMAIPGVDHLGKQTLGNPWISIVGIKICSSVAHTTGRPRALSESFGIMDWDTTYTHLKRVTDWQYALGVNLLVPHAMFHTISGATKRECPPSFFYQSPHWQDFGHFGDYVRRLEEMLCGGRHICKVAVVYPSSGLWASYQSDRKTTEFAYTDNALNSLCLELVRGGIDFDLVDFPALAAARLEGGAIELADESYEFLIVPATPYLRHAEVARLTEIVRSGVRTAFLHKSMEPIEHNLPEALRGASFVRTEELVSFIDVLKRQLDHDIQIVGGGAEDILLYRREKDGRKITFLVNRSEKHRKVTAMMKDYPEAAIFDPETGAYSKLEGRTAGPKLQAQLRFQPNQSYFIVSHAPDAPEPRQPEGEPVPIAITGLRASVPFNVASIYSFTYTKPGAEPAEIDVRTNPRCIPCNWDPNPPDFTQFAGTYEAEIELDLAPEGISLIVDRDFADCELYLNGQRLTLAPCCPSPESQISNLKSQIRDPQFLTDFQDVRAAVSGVLVRGTNRFRVVSPTKLAEPLRLVGDFRVRMQGKRVCLVEPGELNLFNLELDCPFYSGTVTYTAAFELSTEYASLALNLHDVRDAATLRVNGREAGKRLWPPYIFEIAELAHPGANTLEIEVRNNMTNLILGNARPLGLQSMPTLAGFTG